MSELNFPKNPAVGQECTFNSLLYMFDGVRGGYIKIGTGHPETPPKILSMVSTAQVQFNAGVIDGAITSRVQFLSKYVSTTLLVCIY